MVLSSTERSYFVDSLSAVPIIRPDGRSAHQFRPLVFSSGFLPNSNGSARILVGDGSECIVSVKSKLIDLSLDKELVVVDIDIAGQRDDSPLVKSMASILSNLMLKNLEAKKLHMTLKYAFKLYIDVLVLCSSSYPLSLISFSIYVALNSTFLPKLISKKDDLKVEELPVFHDYDFEKLVLDVPLLFTVAIIGENVIVDPSGKEEEVAENGIIIAWNNGKIVTPIRNITLNDSFSKGFSENHIINAINAVKTCAPQVTKALDSE